MRQTRWALGVVLLAGMLAGCGGDDAYESPHKYAADAGVMSDGSAGDFAWMMGSDRGAAPPPGQTYGKWVENDFKDPAKDPLSTFSIDVDTASYTIMRQALNSGALPAPDGVRVEEYVNYFNYSYAQPPAGEPFSINMEGAPSPFGTGYHLLRVGLQGLVLPKAERKPANLVFLIDVSGSMGSSNKLPLVKSALIFLLGQLEPKDTLGIVTYASTVIELLQPTAISASTKAQVTAKINGLYASGGTAGGPGIQKAYTMAKSAMITGGINRVILCTDGDFNIGLSGAALISYIEQKRKEGVTLSGIGFGTGNYKDTLLEELTNKGNGNYAYIDTQKEAEKVFGEKLLGTLQVIAKDVKIQVEYDPKTIKKYRLVGYENRLLKPSDFKDDTKDAGEIGAGHNVTAFYELETQAGLQPGDVLATVRFRYKEPDGTVSKELIQVIRVNQLGPTFDQASADLRFAAAVVEFAEILRKSKHSQGAQFGEVKKIAAATAGGSADRLELVGLVTKAASLWPASP